jgi:hypothetical protein
VEYVGLHLQHVVKENANELIATQDTRSRCRMEVITTFMEQSSREADGASDTTENNLLI